MEWTSRTSFSALQRAENSSIALRKVLAEEPEYCFSALQRAENSSIEGGKSLAFRGFKFQCSSASRKFLNALCCTRRIRSLSDVSVLFSEPKIPQLIAIVESLKP